MGVRSRRDRRFLREGDSSPGHSVGPFSFAPAQRSGREARPDPSNDQVNGGKLVLLIASDIGVGVV
ncbi:unnamed protein product [Musa hybrid cultivar]